MSLTGFYRLIHHSQNIETHQEDIYIGIKQLSQYTLGTTYKDVGTIYQYVDYEKQDNEIVFERGRLVKKPGYETLLTNVENGYFEIQNDHIYVCFQRDEVDYRFLVTYAKAYQEEQNDETQQ